MQSHIARSRCRNTDLDQKTTTQAHVCTHLEQLRSAANEAHAVRQRLDVTGPK